MNQFQLMRKSGMLIILAMLNSISYAQTGVGGVGSSANLPMWFDANELNLTDGSSVFQFDDISGNNNHLTQSTSARRPIYSENILNGLPVVTFDGVNDFLTRGATSGLTGTDFSYFIVFKRTSGQYQCLIDVGYASLVSKWTTYSLSNDRLISLHKSPTSKFVYHIDSGSPTFVSTHITSTNLRQYKQGTLQQSLNTSYTAAASHNLIRVGAYNYNLTTGYYLNGYIAEIIVYNSQLNNLQRVIIENYLGAKYNMAVPSDLYAYESTNNIGLIALGNNGTNTQTSAKGYGILTMSAPSDLTANEYLMVAHTNKDLSDFTTAGLPPSIPSHQYFTRTWRAGETGDVGNVTLTFDLSGGNDFADPTSYRLLVDTDANFSDATVLTGTYDGGTQTVSFTVNLVDGQFFTLAGLFQSLVINSITTGNWSNPNTWDCACVPGPFDQVFIQPTHTVEIDATANTLDLEIVLGGTLSMSTDNTLNIKGNFNNYGTLSAGIGTIEFNGSNDQIFDDLGNGTDFYNLTINNESGDVQFFASDIVLNGTLSLENGNLDLTDAGMNFVVNSTSSTSGGRIGPILGSSQLLGEISVRRFIPAGIPDWRDLCSPVIGATFNDWDPDLAMSGPSFPDGCAAGGGDPCFKSVRYTFNGTSNYVLDVNTAITNTKGYYLWLADDLTSFSGTTLTSKGTINNSSDINITLANGWHTLGNPYVSPSLYSSADKTSNVSNYFYIYDNTIGDYQWYDGSSGLGSIPELDNGLIAIGQGIWIYFSGSGTLTWHQIDKTSSNATYIRSSELEAANKTLTLKLSQEGTTYQTSVMFEMNPLASDGLDSLADMRYLENGFEASPRLYLNLNSELVRKNFVKDDFKNKSFELQSKFKSAGYYTFSIDNIAVAEGYRSVLLYDNFTNEFVDLKIEDYYSFYTDIYEGQRFTLIFTNELIEAGSTVASLTSIDMNGTIELVQMANTFNLKINQLTNGTCAINVYDILGQRSIYKLNLSLNEGSNLFTLPSDLHGIHIISIEYGDELITKKVVL